jgi:hypothetical protein
MEEASMMSIEGVPSASARKQAAAPRQPTAGRRTMQGTNQYRRVTLDAFFAAQRARVDRLLDQHAALIRERLREANNPKTQRFCLGWSYRTDPTAMSLSMCDRH